MKFLGKVGSGPLSKRLNFNGDPDHRLDTGIVSVFVTIGRYGKLHQPTAMARRCSAEHVQAGIAIAVMT